MMCGYTLQVDEIILSILPSWNFVNQHRIESITCTRWRYRLSLSENYFPHKLKSLRWRKRYSLSFYSSFRQSEKARSKLMEGHSVFTDLSDRRRPQKLSEMFSEIYDNQWTNAFECLSLEAKTGGDQSDRAIIKRLLDIIMVCH